jgi:hypothetical protein
VKLLTFLIPLTIEVLMLAFAWQGRPRSVDRITLPS